MGAGLFWAFVLELFEDRSALTLGQFAPALLLLLLGLKLPEHRLRRLINGSLGTAISTPLSINGALPKPRLRSPIRRNLNLPRQSNASAHCSTVSTLGHCLPNSPKP
jgi:hypothetical protein